jgi:hypothetical protein
MADVAQIGDIVIRQIGLQFTNRCHGRCIMCDNRLSKRKFEYFPPDKLPGIVKQIKAIGANTRQTPTGVCGDGEAVYHPEFESMIKVVAESLYWCFGSNCDALTPAKSIAVLESKPSVVSLSVDALTEATLRKIRPGVKYSRAWEHVHVFIEETKKRAAWDRDFFIQLVVMKQNAHEVNGWIDYWLPLVENIPGFKLHIKPVFLWPRLSEADAESFYPSPAVQVPEHPKIQVSPETKSIRETCRLLWDFVWIMSNGAYNPCCMCADDVWNVGNVFEDTIVSIYNSVPLQRYQRLFEEGKFDQLPLCGKCR